MVKLKRAKQLLLPLKSRFIFASLLISWLIDIFLQFNFKWLFLPSWCLGVLVFWHIYQPKWVGLGWAFALGLGTDLFLNQNLGITPMVFLGVIAISHLVRSRIIWLSGDTPYELLWIFQIYLADFVLNLLIHWPYLTGLQWTWLLLRMVLQIALWPLLSFILFYPQKLPPNQDANRPVL